MRNTIILTAVLFIAVIAASIYYFADINSPQINTSKSLKYHPANTVFVAAFNNDEVTSNIFSEFDLFEALIGQTEFLELNALKSNLLNAPSFAEYTKGAEILFSAHQVKDSLAFLFTIPLNRDIPKADLRSLLGKLNQTYAFDSKDSLNQEFYTLTHTLTKNSLYAVYFNDNLYASYHFDLLAQVIDKQSPKLSASKIEYFVSHISKNSPLSILVNHSALAPFAQAKIQGKFGSYLGLLDSLKGESSWNLNFKEDAIMFNGESNLADTKEHYLTLFSKQQAVNQTLSTYFPANTASYFSYSISNQNSFLSELSSYLDQKKENQKRKNLYANLAIDFEKEYTSLWGDEFALVELNTENNIGFVRLKDTTQALSLLSKISSEQSDGISRLNHSNILYFAFGDPFQQLQRPYFIRIQDVLIFANQSSLLSSYLSDWNNKKVLSGNIAYKNFEKLQGNRANVSFYLNPELAKNSIQRKLKNALAKKYTDTEQYGYQDFSTWSFQLSGNNGKLISHIYAIYKSKKAIGGTAEWTYALKGRLTNKPWVLEYSESTKFILAQEQDHTVHAIGTDGEKLWSKVFEGEILGDPIQLSDRSIILNTTTRLYKIFPNGENYVGFSLPLPYRATYGPSLADINANKIIFIPAGTRILAYDLDGKQQEQWKDIQVDGTILFDIKIANIRQKPHIMLGTQSGNFYFFDQNAVKIQEISDAHQYNNPIGFHYQAEQEERSSIITVSADAELVKFHLNGEKTILHYANWSKPTYFSFQNVTGSPASDIVLLDADALSVYQVNDTTANYHYNFAEKTRNRPQFFPSNAHQYYIGQATENDLIYVFNDEGAIYPGFPLAGLHNFYFGPINYGNTTNYLISTKRDHKIYCYKF